MWISHNNFTAFFGKSIMMVLIVEEKMRFKFLMSCLLIIIMLVACGANTPVEEMAEPETQPAQEESNAEEMPTGVIVVGDISDEPIKKIERFQPFADYLAGNLTDYGIGQGEVKIAPDMDTMIQWINNGEVDIYIDSVYPAMIIGDATGATPILRRWKDDIAEYHSVIFTREESEINEIGDLVGHTIAFEEPFSTSGHMLPRTYLIEEGYSVEEKSSATAGVAEEEIGFTFSGEDQNTLQWVVSGEVVAGATDNQSYNELLGESDSALKIIAETESVPRNVVMLRAGFDEDAVSAIKMLMSELDESEEGLELLERLKTSQFDEFPEGADPAFNRLRELYRLTQEE